MKERAVAMTGGKATGVTISTFHAFGVKVLREWISTLGYSRDFSIYDQADKMSLLKDIAREVHGSVVEVDLYECAQVISSVKTGRVSWDESNERYREIYRLYLEHTRAFNSLDFDDLIVLPIKLFETSDEALAALRERYRYIMVDEFQDTSIAQYRIVELLARKHRNLCVVGDDDQSIYSWRGANYLNMAYFERDFNERVEIRLEQNYRSAKDILTAANSVIANNQNRKKKELWTGLEADRCIEAFFPVDEYDEARSIARIIRGIVSRGVIPFNEIGILVRTNSLMAPIEEALLAENIAYAISGGSSFFQRKEVKDTVAYLRVFANPDDNVSLLRIINTPKRGIGRKTVQYLRDLSQERSESIYSTVQAVAHASDGTLGPKITEQLGEFAELVERQRSEFLTPKKLGKKLERLLDEIDFWGYIIADNPENERLARFKYRSVLRLAEMIDVFERDPDLVNPTLFDFLARITLITRDDNQDEEDQKAVHLMTIHAAKGLEFEVVFLAGAEEELMPHAKAIEEDEVNIEEERRLFYVAVTRAKQKLLISSCQGRNIMRQLRERTPSRFIDEIPAELIHVHEADEPVDVSEAASFFEKIRSRLG
jgi:DNA helicase II / ATP-dependent DNA helicase PcrA